jgi:hypothetical protein
LNQRIFVRLSLGRQRSCYVLLVQFGCKVMCDWERAQGVVLHIPGWVEPTVWRINILELLNPGLDILHHQ